MHARPASHARELKHPLGPQAVSGQRGSSAGFREVRCQNLLVQPGSYAICTYDAVSGGRTMIPVSVLSRVVKLAKLSYRSECNN